MRNIEAISKIFERYGGMMRTYQLSNEKIYYADIVFLLKEGVIEKVRTGYYQWVDNSNLSEAASQQICSFIILVISQFSGDINGIWQCFTDFFIFDIGIDFLYHIKKL